MATQTPAETPPRPRAPTPPPAVEPPAPTGTLSVITTSSGATQPPITVDGVQQRAGRTLEIPDPIGFWKRPFRTSRELIRRCVEGFVDQLPPQR